jgi:hypothetical protein
LSLLQRRGFKALRIAGRIRATRYAINSHGNQFEGRRKSHSAGCDCKKKKDNFV